MRHSSLAFPVSRHLVQVSRPGNEDLYGALKPGGILAIEHRADPGEQDPQAASGCVTEAYVIEQAQKAGFDRSKYDAIGESDRMTLKFRKPVTAAT